VAGPPRDRLSLELLGPEPPPGPKSQAASSGVDVGRDAKITVRVAPHIARKIAAQAGAAGLSQGVYLSTLIAGAPVILTGADHRRAVAALTASNDEIARVAANINGLVRELRRATVSSAGEVEATLEALSSEVRAHLRYASLIADLAPVATVSRAGAAEKAGWEEAVR